MEHGQVVAGGAHDDRSRWLAIGAAAVLMGLVLRTAWVTEDAYITLRTVDNWVNGYGLRWNTDERVQGYTHPLWMMALSAVYFVVRESYVATLLLGLSTTAVALFVISRYARSPGHAAAALTLLLLSRSFIDFSTSGLENPLTHVLVVLFIGQYVLREASLVRLSLIAALLTLNRTDALIVLIPALTHAGLSSLRTRGFKTTFFDVLLGFSPLISWELFSLFYYGFLVPNTAFAKLNTGIEASELARQGLTYLLNAVAWDPPIMVIVGMGIAVGLFQKRLRHQLLAVGVLLYLGYVLRIGGDFMLGRFLTLPLVVCALLIAQSTLPLDRPERVFLLLLPFFTLFFHPNALDKYPVGEFNHTGIADERMYFRNEAGLMTINRHRVFPEHHWFAAGKAQRALGKSTVRTYNIGYYGFAAGPDVHIIDQLALSEPLLARLPMRYDSNWRVGHYAREIPIGYEETIRTGKCQLQDHQLCRYYEKLRLIISGKLWSWERLKTIVMMNLGRYDHFIDEDRYRFPTLAHATAAELATPVEDGAAWADPRARMLSQDGLRINLGKVRHSKWFKLTLDSNDTYRIELRKGTKVIEKITSSPVPQFAMSSRLFTPSPESVEKGYDSITVRPSAGDGMYSVAYLRLGK